MKGGGGRRCWGAWWWKPLGTNFVALPESCLRQGSD